MNQSNGLKTDEISIYHIVLDLVKNIWVILLVAAAVWLGLGSVAKMMYVPEYTASATVAVGTKGKNTNSLNSLNTTKQLAGAFGEVFQSNVLMDKVREDGRRRCDRRNLSSGSQRDESYDPPGCVRGSQNSVSDAPVSIPKL